MANDEQTRNTRTLPLTQRAPRIRGVPLTQSPGSFRQKGTSLSWGAMGAINGFLSNPSHGFIQEYERAFQTDETISVAIEFIVTSMLASLGEYEHPRKECQKFVRDNLTYMEGTIHSVFAEALTSAKWSGHAVSESILAQDGRHVILTGVQNYHPGNVFYVVDKHGRLTHGKEPGIAGMLKTGVYQRNPFTGQYVHLPRNRTCVITNRMRHNNYYGESSIQPVYKNFLFKDAVFGMWAVALDRYGTPIPVAIVPRVNTGVPVTDPYSGGTRPQTYAEQAVGVFQDLSAGGSLVFEEYSKDHPVKISALTSQNNFGTSFLDAVRYTNTAIFRGMLIPKLLLEEGKSGSSKGLGTIHFHSFRMMLRSLYKTMVQPMVQQIIGPILYWNFGERDPGCFPIVPFDAVTSEIIGYNFDKFVATGLIDLDSLNDMNKMRNIYGLSPLSPGQLNKRRYLAEAAQGINPQSPKSQAATRQVAVKPSRVSKPGEKQAKPKQDKPVQLSVSAQNLPEVVVVVVVDDNGRILLVRRSMAETHRAGEWETPGGHRDPGEMVVVAAAREVLEETGLSITPDIDAQLTFPLREGGFGMMVGARLIGAPRIVLKRDEHDRYDWVWPEDLDDYAPTPPDFTRNVSDVWEQLMGESLDETDDRETDDEAESDD